MIKKIAIFLLSTVLGVIILGVLTEFLADYLRQIAPLQTILSFMDTLKQKLYEGLMYQIKVWVVLTSLLVFYVAWKLWTIFRQEPEPEKPPYYNYTSDTFHSWTWKWSWVYHAGTWKVAELRAYCPNDGTLLNMKNEILRIRVNCPRCKTVWESDASFSSQRAESIDDTLILIKTKVENWTY